MRFNLVGKHKAVITKIDPQAVKMGQTGLVPACALFFKLTISNKELFGMLNKNLLPFFYDKGGKPASQGVLDGVDVLSDLPSLTEAGIKMGRQHWTDEQPGSKLIIYQGASGQADIRVRDVTIDKLDWLNKEGGGCEVRFRAYFADTDKETIGGAGVLKKREIDIEVIAPESVGQKTIEEAVQPAGKKATTKSPEQGLAEALQEAEDTPETQREKRNARDRARRAAKAAEAAKGKKK